MGLRTALPSILNTTRNNTSYFEHNETLFNIYEGELLPYVERMLKQQLSAQSFITMKHRLAPINLLKKIVSVLSSIYQQPITRRVVDGTNTDSELLVWYEESYKVNQILNGANEFFNLFKTTLLQPYLSRDGTPRLRSIPSHQFWVFSDDPVEPTKPTGVTLFMGKTSNGEKIFHSYTDDEILITDQEGKVLSDRMAAQGLDGSNPIGKIPFVYVNRSMNLLHPKVDTDLLKLTILASILVSDMNYVSCFSAFSILYGINVKDEGLAFAPNAFWNFSQIDPAAKPELGTLKNNGDIMSMIALIKFELGLWLSSRGLKSSAVSGDDQSITGIAKMIDNIDTTDERKKQVEFFRNAEVELWDLTMNYLHPRWRNDPRFASKATFSPSKKVEIVFAEQVPLFRRGDVVASLKAEMDAGYISRISAMKKLNPHWSDADIADEIALIDNDSTINVADEPNV